MRSFGSKGRAGGRYTVFQRAFKSFLLTVHPGCANFMGGMSLKLVAAVPASLPQR